MDFCDTWELEYNQWAREELIKFRTVRIRIVRYRQSIDARNKSEVGKNQLRRSAGKFSPMYYLLVGNDTVPSSVWRTACTRVPSDF